VTVGGVLTTNNEPSTVLIHNTCNNTAFDDDPEQEPDIDTQRVEGSTVHGSGEWHYNDEADPGNRHAINCSVDGDARGAWKVYLPLPDSEDCTDYGDVECSWDNGSATRSLADSPRPACTAGSGTFRLVHHTWHDSDNNGTGWSSLLPILVDGDDFPERAWLRTIEVTAWRDASELFLVEHTHALEVDGSDSIDTTYTESLTPLNDDRSFSVGEIVMGTVFAAEGVDLVGGDEMPTVDISWTCEQASPPDPLHYVDLNPPQAWGERVKDLPDIGFTGIDARVILRIDGAKDEASIELQGRRSQRFIVPLTQTSGNTWTFDHQSAAFAVDAVGTITRGTTDTTIVFSTLLVEGIDFDGPTWTLDKFTE
jgi:hypothetical protein